MKPIKYIYLILSLITFKLVNGQKSPLADGKWLKYEIKTEGIYRLAFNDLVSNGFSASDIESKYIKIYSQYGAAISEIIDTRPLGLREIPSQLQDKNGNSKLNDGEEILFYGIGPHQIQNEDPSYPHANNPYSNSAFYYVTLSSTNSLAVANADLISTAPEKTFYESDFVSFHDSDILNPAHMGRYWIGENIGQNQNSFKFDIPLPNYVRDSLKVNIQIFDVTKSLSSFIEVNVNNNVKSYTAQPLNSEYAEMDNAQLNFLIRKPFNSVNTSFYLDNKNPQSAAYLDYIKLIGKIDLQKAEGYITLRNSNSIGFENVAFLTNKSSSPWLAWDISNRYAIKLATISETSTNTLIQVKNNNKAAIIALFNLSSLKTPTFISTVQNQNISAEPVKELIVIYHPRFVNAVNELIDLKNKSGISCKKVNIYDIYNEFSYGQLDLTAIRDYLRLEALKVGTNGDKLKYVLLMGSASYDNKDRLKNNTNYIPIYSNESWGKTSNFTTDDYLANFELGKGIPTGDSYRDSMQFCIGRVPARNEDHANTFVTKLKKYSSKTTLGPWRNNISFVSDDRENGGESVFVNDSEFGSNALNTRIPAIHTSKIYMDAFVQESTGNREEYPTVNKELKKSFENGSLFINYVGHGGERGWAQESILDISSINSFKQPKGNYPILFTATCEFSRNDDPSLQSGGEQTLFNPNGGSIALLTTTRLVFIDGNSIINQNFWNGNGFPVKAQQKGMTIGEMYRTLKNSKTYTSELYKFNLLGDPSMKPNFPEHEIQVDSLNGIDFTQSQDDLKAFSLATIIGSVRDANKTILTDFNGELYATLYDKISNKLTLNNDGQGPVPYKQRDKIVFNGKVDVKNGKFIVKFIVPKDIAYNIGKGRLYLYANSATTDANGYADLNVGGSITPSIFDTKGPIVEPFMNDFTFIGGDKIASTSTIVARINDINGINATGSGVGRNIIAIIDEGTKDELVLDLNSSFLYATNSYTKGVAKLEVQDLTPGNHKLTIKAWDVFNNLGKGETWFSVLNPNQLVITESSVFPNPFTNNVSFKLKHNRAGQELKAKIKIFDTKGQLIAKVEQIVPESQHVDTQINWDGTSQSNAFVTAGVYIYQLIIEDTNGNNSTVTGKIIKN